MDIQILPLTPDMAADYIDFFENRAFCNGSVNKGCYCVWHHWTEQHERERSQLPVEQRPFRKRDYAIQLITEGRLHGFAAYCNHQIVGFCNADLKEHYFRFSRERHCASWVGLQENDRVLALVCFTVAPGYRGQGIAKQMLRYACEYARQHGYDFVESYPCEGEFKPDQCCGSRSMYEAQGFEILGLPNGILARKRIGC